MSSEERPLKFQGGGWTVEVWTAGDEKSQDFYRVSHSEWGFFESFEGWSSDVESLVAVLQKALGRESA